MNRNCPTVQVSFWKLTQQTHMLQSKVHFIQNTAYRCHRPRPKASYMIGSGANIKRNQPAAQIAARQTIPFHRWHNMVAVGIDPGVSHLGGEIVGHYITDYLIIFTIVSDIGQVEGNSFHPSHTGISGDTHPTYICHNEYGDIPKITISSICNLNWYQIDIAL